MSAEAAIAAGLRVIVPGGQLATVVSVGDCGWGGCKSGAMCVTVRQDRYSTTTNHDVDRLTVANCQEDSDV